MIFRRAGALAVVGALAFGMAGCVGTPAAKPSTSAPAFASDEEAYKAAEKVYREYVDALNNVDLADPKTFEPVFALTTGEANAEDRKRLTSYHADGAVVGGATRVALAEGVDASADRTRVTLEVCDDVSRVTVKSADGASLVSPSRPNIQPLEVVLTSSTSKYPRYLISEVVGRNDGPAC